MTLLPRAANSQSQNKTPILFSYHNYFWDQYLFWAFDFFFFLSGGGEGSCFLVFSISITCLKIF